MKLPAQTRLSDHQMSARRAATDSPWRDETREEEQYGARVCYRYRLPGGDEQVADELAFSFQDRGWERAEGPDGRVTFTREAVPYAFGLLVEPDIWDELEVFEPKPEPQSLMTMSNRGTLPAPRAIDRWNVLNFAVGVLLAIGIGLWTVTASGHGSWVTGLIGAGFVVAWALATWQLRTHGRHFLQGASRLALEATSPARVEIACETDGTVVEISFPTSKTSYTPAMSKVFRGELALFTAGKLGSELAHVPQLEDRR